MLTGYAARTYGPTWLPIYPQQYDILLVIPREAHNGRLRMGAVPIQCEISTEDRTRI
jgi:hypothetical protein